MLQTNEFHPQFLNTTMKLKLKYKQKNDLAVLLWSFQLRVQVGVTA